MIDLERCGAVHTLIPHLTRPFLAALLACAVIVPAARAHDPSDIAVELSTLTRDAGDAGNLIGLPVQVSVTCGNRMRSILHGTLQDYDRGTASAAEQKKHIQIVWLPAGCTDIVLHGKILRRPHSDSFFDRMIENIGRNNYLTDGDMGANPDWWEIFDTSVLFHKCQQDAIDDPEPGSEKTYRASISLRREDGYFCTLVAE
ncbi:hypothetical protein ACFOGJ_30195 [Marinibaculum pumilum]|uniref:Secreted protein n=1 Tax=Marinibaculum pumilum TaxID=1766165 RepID=A0ABV7LBD0_9PROT